MQLRKEKKARRTTPDPLKVADRPFVSGSSGQANQATQVCQSQPRPQGKGKERAQEGLIREGTLRGTRDCGADQKSLWVTMLQEDWDWYTKDKGFEGPDFVF